jgi:hypothetical protein
MRVYNAGHMVPMDQPFAALHMLNSWINATLAPTKQPAAKTASTTQTSLASTPEKSATKPKCPFAKVNKYVYTQYQRVIQWISAKLF